MLLDSAVHGFLITWGTIGAQSIHELGPSVNVRGRHIGLDDFQSRTIFPLFGQRFERKDDTLPQDSSQHGPPFFVAIIDSRMRRALSRRENGHTTFSSLKVACPPSFLPSNSCCNAMNAVLAYNAGDATASLSCPRGTYWP